MNVHIGTLIRAKAMERRVGPTELAALINTSKQNVFNIYGRKSIDCDLLYKICAALKFDFFIHYSTGHTMIFEDHEAPDYSAKKPGKAKTEKQVLMEELNECRKNYIKLKEVYLYEEKQRGKNAL